MTTLADIRHGFRLLCRAPAVTLIAILITAFGVGAATVVYAAVKAVLIEPFPYSHPEALVQIRADLVVEATRARTGSRATTWTTWHGKIKALPPSAPIAILYSTSAATSTPYLRHSTVYTIG